ncbi:hypothetical protein B0F90DRAFT_1672007 [Multifurca ochricompacta]|uniref:Uncharacterized protein n=1 Tax=Multifurca ochricompacta TaxID=376703 RepID=A0AAD4LTI1_9AGAM|nr:hypothetical protein B0F90DRAFT_1672007 [Multifurca ochricompacta]
MASSSKKKNTLSLAALAPLHALVQLVPTATDARTKTRDDRGFILLTSLKLDAWFVHVGHPDGRWWNGAWRAADVEILANGDTSSARVGAFAQRVARMIIKCEVAIAHDDDFQNMKLVVGTQVKKPLHIALSELGAEDAASFVFEYFTRVAEEAQAHGCRILHLHETDTDTHMDPQTQGVSLAPSKRKRTHSSDHSQASSRASSPRLSHKAHHTAQGGHDKSMSRHKTRPQARTSESTTQAEVDHLKAELARARADAAAAVALAAEREPSGFGGSVDRLFSRSAVPAIPRRPGASLANPNKAARRVVAVEFASDSDEA